MKNKDDLFWALPGMRIKMSLPTKWCGLEKIHKSPTIWLKGKIVSMPSDNAMVVKLWSRKYKWLKIDDMMCFRKDGKFRKIVKQL